MNTNGNVSLTASEISDLIVSRLMSQIKEPGKKLRPIYLLAHAGVGKTQITHQAAKLAEAKIREFLKKPITTRCQTTALVFMEPPEFLGLCHITIDPKDKEEMTVFARPSLIPKDGYGILFFDEANRANREIRSGLLTLIEDREINGHKLGDGWIIVLAGNPANDRYQGASEFDPALLDRVCPVWFRGEAKETIKYLKAKYPGNWLVDVLEEHPKLIDFDAKGRGTPRGLEYAIRATGHITEDLNKGNKELMNLLACELGLELTSTIIGLVSQKVRDLSIEDVLNNPAKAKKFLEDNYTNTDIVSSVEKKVREHIWGVCKTYTREKEIKEVPLFNEKDTTALISFMEALPPENFLTMLRAIEDDGTLDYNLEFVFGTTFSKKSEKLKEFVVRLYETGKDESGSADTDAKQA
jgi:hypothetical protein